MICSLCRRTDNRIWHLWVLDKYII